MCVRFRQRYMRYKWAVTRLQALRRGKQTRQNYLTMKSRNLMQRQKDAVKALNASIEDSKDVHLTRMGPTKQLIVYVVPEELAQILGGG